MKSTGAWSRNELHWLDLHIGHQDNISNPVMATRVTCPVVWGCSDTEIHNVKYHKAEYIQQTCPHSSCMWVWNSSNKPGTFYKGLMSSLLKSCQHSFCSNIDIITPIRSEFCTYHDSSSVVTCAKFWPDWIIILLIRLTRVMQSIFYKIWIMSS